VRRSAVLAGLLALGVAGTAHADIVGTVKTPAGLGVPGQRVEADEPDGSFAASATTDGAGRYRIPTSDLSFDTPPFTIKAESSTCRNFGEADATAQGGPVNDGATVDLTLDARLFCAASSSFGSTPPTGNPWPERGLFLATPGGTFNIQVQAEFANNYTVTLDDGTVIGTSTSRFGVPFTAPAAPYNGPIKLVYTDSNGAIQTAVLGTLISGTVSKPAPPSGTADIAAIVDISGSMSGNDPTFRRKDAVEDLINLSDQGDRLVGTGFDDAFHEIFPRTTIAGQSTKSSLIRLARKNIVNAGGTDYNDGIGAAFDALAADPENPQVPKAAIFLTDGAHNSGDYQNAHLRFAFNGTGRPWPICVIQLGTSFASSDTARLRRIATETGGSFAKANKNSKLQELFFQCRGRSSGAATILKKTSTFRVGQSHTFRGRVKKGQRKAIFFVAFGEGKYRIQLDRPGKGGFIGRSIGKRIRLVKGRRSAFFELLQPATGLYLLKVTRLATGGPTDQATTTITVQRKQ
jgi:hypothetical protein